MIFRALKDALDAGFMVYDRTQDGYLMRKHTDAGFVLARVILRGGHAQE